MADPADTAPEGTPAQDEVTESPATWENLVVGKGKHLLGEAIRARDLVEEGEEQAEIAHEVHDEAESHRAARHRRH